MTRRASLNPTRLALVISLLSATFLEAAADPLDQSLAQLPRFTEDVARPVETDWLVVPTGRPAGVYRAAHEHEIVMTNGLIRRTFRLAPNAATVAFDNMMTGASVIRGVKPEAVIELEGAKYDVGGLCGQVEYGYLLHEWLDGMTGDPDAFQFIGCRTGKTEARFPWKRKRYSADLPWPPPGASLRLDFKAPVDLPQRLAERRSWPSEDGRELLVSDGLTDRKEAWAVQASSRKGAKLEFGEAGGAIVAGENTCVYAERKLPQGAALVQCRVDPGTDKSASWGPGLTVVWPSRVVKFYLRPGKGEFGIWDAGGEHLCGKAEPGKPYLLRLRIERTAIHCEASRGGKAWFRVREIPLEAPLVAPVAVRLGKTSRTGGKDDYDGEPGQLGRCVVTDFLAYGSVSKAVRQKRAAAFAFLDAVTVSVHYEMYDGIPLLCKWLTIRNRGDRAVRLNTFISEILAAVEYEVAVGEPAYWKTPNIHVESDYAFLGMTPRTAIKTTHWVPDPQYTSQINYRLKTPVLLESRPPLGPDVLIASGGAFESFRTFELIYDSTERERKGLALRRMYRTIAPWVTENPILMHARNASPRAVRSAIDQCAEVGFEMVIMSFGSGFNAENESSAYLATYKKLADYAHGKGVELGCYSLLASRRISDEHDAINPKTGKPGGTAFGHSPCLGSRWGQDYFRKLRALFEKTGLDLLEHDGSYPGDVCASTKHPGHRGLNDSQWTQWKTITDFYKWCRGRGIYLNVPDWYFLSGSNKNGMGYREVNWSLPRERQIILGRQNIYDGTWQKTPSMGWMFVPLVQYHGGGAAATLEPLAEHLDAYAAHLAQNFGSGVQACYRGPRLYDTDKTKALVNKWVDFYKKHRAILDSDIIHVRRPDGRDIDCILHVNPQLKEKGLAIVYNPLERTAKKMLTLPLYYTGLTEVAVIREQEGQRRQFRLDRKWNVQVPLEIGPKSLTWLSMLGTTSRKVSRR